LPKEFAPHLPTKGEEHRIALYHISVSILNKKDDLLRDSAVDLSNQSNHSPQVCLFVTGYRAHRSWGSTTYMRRLSNAETWSL